MMHATPDTRPVPKEPYEESSQYKRWYLSADKLREIRQYVKEEAVNRATKAWEEENVRQRTCWIAATAQHDLDLTSLSAK